MAKKKGKARSRTRKAKDLTAKNARTVKGGGGEITARKAGKGQQEFLVVKMTDVIVTGVN